MLQFILKRLGLGVAVAITVSIATFMLLNMSGDPAEMLAGEDADRRACHQ